MLYIDHFNSKNNFMLKYVFLILSLTFTVPGQAQKIDFNDMSESEKAATGIDKLSDTEKAALLKWVQQEQLTIQAASRKKNLGLEKTQTRENNESGVTARLEKQYDNLLGETFYQLDNGQLWKQVSTGSISLDNKGSQTITIEPGFMGSWTLRGDGNRSVKVKRIK